MIVMVGEGLPGDVRLKQGDNRLSCTQWEHSNFYALIEGRFRTKK